MKSFLKRNCFEIIFFTLLFIFSCWLMFHSFGYQNQTILIGSKIWSDFAANLPLIRSFSQGSNFPLQYPLFPNAPIHYHFLFYLLAGILERFGLRLDWALNLPSALSFFFLTVMIYKLAKFLFKSRSVAFLSVIFFLFNGSFSFYEFTLKHPLRENFLETILKNEAFSSVFPFEKSPLSISDIFWNLNVFANQRHLALALAILLFSFLYFIRHCERSKTISTQATLRLPRRYAPRNDVIMGVLLGILPILNGAVFIMAAAVFGTLFSLKPNKNLFILLLTMSLVALPQLLFLRGNDLASSLFFYPGYLIHDRLNFISFFQFWFFNLGLGFLLIPLGFILSPRREKAVFLCFLPIFLIGNLFRFSPDPATNHKFFNLFIIIGNMYTAYALTKLFLKKSLLRVIIFIIIINFILLSGIIDFFAVKNDFQYQIPDQTPEINWIRKKTPPNAIFLNTSYFYHPASLAGRKIFYGWPYFAWSAGYDTETRKQIIINIFQERSLPAVCQILKENKINFVALDKEPTIEEIKSLDYQIFWQDNFFMVYQNQENGLKIYEVKRSCN